MLELFGFLIALGVVGTLALGNKISPVAAGSVVGVGFLVIHLGGILVAGGDRETFLSVFGAWAWIVWVAVFLKFTVAVRAMRKIPGNS